MPIWSVCIVVCIVMLLIGWVMSVVEDRKRDRVRAKVVETYYKRSKEKGRAIAEWLGIEINENGS